MAQTAYVMLMAFMFVDSERLNRWLMRLYTPVASQLAKRPVVQFNNWLEYRLVITSLIIYVIIKLINKRTKAKWLKRITNKY